MHCVDVAIPPGGLFCGLVESWPIVAPCYCLPNLLRLSGSKLGVQRGTVERRVQRGDTMPFSAFDVNISDTLSGFSQLVKYIMKSIINQFKLTEHAVFRICREAIHASNQFRV